MKKGLASRMVTIPFLFLNYSRLQEKGVLSLSVESAKFAQTRWFPGCADLALRLPLATPHRCADTRRGPPAHAPARPALPSTGKARPGPARGCLARRARDARPPRCVPAAGNTLPDGANTAVGRPRLVHAPRGTSHYSAPPIKTPPDTARMPAPTRAAPLSLAVLLPEPA